jgi:hypothetical protein
MEILTSIAKWLFLESIYGIAVIAAAVYFVALGINKIIPKSPNPGILAGLAFLIALFTLPSLPRYQFEKESLSQIEGKEWLRIINETQWGSVTEPLTWFNAPIGSIFMVMPNSPIEGGFREVLLRYEEEPRITMSDPDCSDKAILYSEPDSEGVFRYTSRTPQPMNEQEIAIYCEYDWSNEKEALRAEALKQMQAK